MEGGRVDIRVGPDGGDVGASGRDQPAGVESQRLGASVVVQSRKGGKSVIDSDRSLQSEDNCLQTGERSGVDNIECPFGKRIDRAGCRITAAADLVEGLIAGTSLVRSDGGRPGARAGKAGIAREIRGG